jgi:hypothetical protein
MQHRFEAVLPNEAEEALPAANDARHAGLRDAH